MRLTIASKLSGTGSIHDIASDHDDRDIKFGTDCIYAVVLASYYGGKGYTTHRTAEAAILAARRQSDHSLMIIDREGRELEVVGYEQDRLALRS